MYTVTRETDAYQVAAMRHRKEPCPMTHRTRRTAPRPCRTVGAEAVRRPSSFVKPTAPTRRIQGGNAMSVQHNFAPHGLRAPLQTTCARVIMAAILGVLFSTATATTAHA